MEDSVFLIKVSDEEEAESIEEILSENNIRVWRKYKETEDYLKIYRAMTIYGVELYVNQKDLNKSKRLLNMNVDEIDNTGQKSVSRKRILNLIPFF